ncbi:MAG: SusC/RagA family TonB-linked outer membrane protein [Candidatus Palauibacterales bacterium]|nr:SusC/RagA family TonB-linked outer membrane protein [Candidatus Palauibacterales bacterium]
MRVRLATPCCAFLLFFLGAAWPQAARAQEGTLSGVVSQSSGATLASATVRLLGTDAGALTDENGHFVLTIAPGTYQVRVTLIGFTPVVRSATVRAGETTTLDFTLKPQALSLGELVVSVAAAATRREELGTDVELLDAATEVQKGAVSNVSDLLNARTTGVSIDPASGEVGSASQIRVRGSTSITQDNNPLVYIDGVRVSNETGSGPGSFDFGNGQTISRIDDLNPQDIADIQVVKGPSATALYGSEAAAGVILITTKHGQSGKPSFAATVQEGMNRDVANYPANFYDLTSNAGITDVADPNFQQWQPVLNPVTDHVFAQNNPLMNPATRPFRNGLTQAYNMSVRGGTDVLGYYGSMGYDHQNGTLPDNYLQRFTGRANLSTSVGNLIHISLNSNFITSHVRLPDNDRSAVGVVTNAGAGLPIYSHGLLPNNTKGDCLGTVVAGLDPSLCDIHEGNLTANFPKLETIQNTQDLGRFIGSAVVQANPTSWLTGRATAGIDYSQTKNRNLVPLDPDRPFGSNSKGLVNDGRVTERITSLDVTTTASWRLTEALSGQTSAGAQYVNRHSETVGCSGQGGFASTTAIACDAALTATGFSDLLEEIEGGAFLQQQLSYRDYLFVTGAVRVDNNSAFGVNQGAIVSPSANGSLVLSKMPFWHLDKVNDFRLRFAWGKAAQAPNPFAADRTFRPVRLLQNGSEVTGIAPFQPGNPDLTAERNEEFEGGFDASLFKGRLSVKGTYFHQKTTNAIVQTDVAPSTGYYGGRFVNIGALTNHGLEGLISGEVIAKDNVSWELGLKVSTQDSKVSSLGGQPTILFGLSADHQMFREGYAPGAYFGQYVQSADRDAQGNIVPGSVVMAPGDIGDPLRPYDSYLGRPDPSNEQSLSTTLTLFKRIRVYTLFERAGGFMKMDEGERFRTPFIPGFSTSRRFALRQNESPEMQAMMEMKFNTPFVHDGTFVKWRDLTVSYDLPEAVTRYMGFVKTASLMVGGHNLATFTNYPGLDPELRFDGGTDSYNAADFFTLPPARSYFARLSVTF